jgi:hypothetical protein
VLARGLPADALAWIEPKKKTAPATEIKTFLSKIQRG